MEYMINEWEINGSRFLDEKTSTSRQWWCKSIKVIKQMYPFTLTECNALCQNQSWMDQVKACYSAKNRRHCAPLFHLKCTAWILLSMRLYLQSPKELSLFNEYLDSLAYTHAQIRCLKWREGIYSFFFKCYCNLRSSLLRCGTRPIEWGTQWDSNSLLQVC